MTGEPREIPDAVIQAGMNSGWLDTKCCHCEDCNRETVELIARAAIDAWDAHQDAVDIAAAAAEGGEGGEGGGRSR